MRPAPGLAATCAGALHCATLPLDREHDPIAFLRAFPDEHRFLWAQASAGRSIAAVGATTTLEAGGRHAAAQISRALRELEIDGAPCGLPLIGGFAFDADRPADGAWRGFPAAAWHVPRLALVARRGSAHLIATASGEASQARPRLAALLDGAAARLARPARTARLAPVSAIALEFRIATLGSVDAWRRAVEATLADIDAGRLDKLVLARAIELVATAGLDPLRAAERLRESYPGCTVFAVGRGDATFVGATPERLARVAGERVETAAVAGSARRGERPADDRAAARALAASPKEALEHTLVRDDLIERLGPLCRSLETATPRVLRTAAVQHLCTPLRGRLRSGMGVLEVASALHPTPAVCGTPREAALELVARRESAPRGWYGGCVGWVDAGDRRSGELAVAIRSALVRGERAWLYAGAGIVAGSRWEDELEETRVKLRPLLHALVEA